jgi:hypothetical protein
MKDRPAHAGWHRQPLFWLSSLILVASLAGCAWMIVLAMRYPDPALDTGRERILKVPLSAPSASAPAASR